MKKKYNIEIELLSDLCVSDGGSYNSSIDTDVCHDSYGFPYIPAKRLKGCFRESCLELNDWGKDIPLKELFGDIGNKRAAFSLSNAYIKGYKKYLDIVKNNKNSLLFHPQNILSKYTYVRQQTSVDYNTGVAKSGSLRSIRVVNKGNIFVCEIEIDDKYVTDFKSIVAVTSNIGVNRTRGLGEVKMTLKDSDFSNNDNIFSISIDDSADYLTYHIYLEEPIICKGFNSNDLNTIDYFEGNKVLGVIANNSNDFIDLINKDELFVSNAYLEYDGRRMKEIPNSYYSYKNDKKSCFDKSQFKFDISKQVSKMKHSYSYLDNDNILHLQSVSISDSYHHSRPEDKSFGHSLDEGENGSSKFFQISSIDSDQCFSGYITGSNEQIKEIYNILNNLECRIGFGRSSEFGKVKFTVDKPEKILDKSINTKRFIVKLESPAIIYNDKAFYSIDNNDLIYEINKALNINEMPVEVYSSLTKIGGFNVTWGYRKPIMQAFDKGTVLIYELNKEELITLKAKTYIGERIQEGYGEISISECNGSGLYNIYGKKYEINNEYIECKDGFVKELVDMLFNQYLDSCVSNTFDSKHSDTSYRPVVSNMLLMFKNNDISYFELDETINNRYNKNSDVKKEKLDKAKNIMNHCNEKIDSIVSEFCNKYKLKNYNVSRDSALLSYIHKYLLEMKYEIRAKEAIND